MTNLDKSKFKKFDASTFYQDISLGDSVYLLLKPDATEFSMLGKGHTYYPKQFPFDPIRNLLVKGNYMEPSVVDTGGLEDFVRVYNAQTNHPCRIHVSVIEYYKKEEEALSVQNYGVA